MKRLIITLMAVVAIVSGVSARQPQKGYRGFLEWSNGLRSEEELFSSENRKTVLYTGFSTSHGYQFNPWLFAGAGVDYNGNNLFALFAEGRADVKFGSFTPFGDLRVGYSVTKGGEYIFHRQ